MPWNRKTSLDLCLIAFSSREPVSTSLENALECFQIMMIPLILMGIAEIQRTQIQRTQIQRLGTCRNRAMKRSTFPGRRKQPRGERLASRWLGGARMNEPTVLANDGILKALTKKSRIIDPPAAA
jgi:hypothetical protein